jgi:hypothetical protein
MAKKTSENAFRILKSRANKEIRGGKRGVGGGRRIFQEENHSWVILCSAHQQSPKDCYESVEDGSA